MRIRKKLITIITMSLLILSVMSIFGAQIFQVGAQGSASLTGTIYDSGVDTDSDEAFNYLKVGVEINVTESGDYHVGVHSLLGTSEWQYIYVEDTETAHLDVGVHVVEVSLYGPMIYGSGIDAANVSYIRLSRIVNDYYEYLDSLSNVPLSKVYNYTEFDSPFTDAEARFIVYPDGQVVMAGAFSYTDIPTRYTGPATQGVVAFSKSDDLTSVSTNCTFTIPPEALSEAPLDSMDFTLSSTGSNDVFDTDINCSVVLSEVTASEFPFNITDFTATGEYDGNLLTGTITLHMLPGFALGDVDVDFKGSITDLSFNGTITVIYGTYYDLEVNETFLNGMIQQINSTFLGQGPGSLYNMTYGSLEGTMLNVAVTYNSTFGATVDFEAAIHGDFAQALAYMSPPETSKLLYSALNATYPSIENASFELAYAHAQKEASMRLRFVIDFNKLVDELIPLLQETVPPEIAQVIQSILETRYCSMKSVDLSFSYDDGEGNLEATVTIEDDLNAELNYLKNILSWSYFLAMIGGVPEELTWQASFVNETEIDVSNVIVSFKLDETSYSGYLGGLAVSPPQDAINATSFKLERFFNLTADAEFPGEEGRLKVTIVGGSNSTHTVTLFRPETVPEPTSTCDSKIMIWDNQTLSDLKDLIFNIEPETGVAICDVANPELISTENPFTVDATETAATSMSITEISKPVTIIVKNVTAPPEGVEAPPGTFQVLGNYVEIIPSETDITVNATIRIYYTQEQLEAAELDEDTLKIHCWNATLGEWVAIESHVNKAEHYVWAIINHFSLWALMGQPLAAPIWSQLWFWAVIGIVVVIVIVAAVFVVRRKKPPSPTLPEPTKSMRSQTK